jgi:hypothetical protein
MTIIVLECKILCTFPMQATVAIRMRVSDHPLAVTITSRKQKYNINDDNSECYAQSRATSF